MSGIPDDLKPEARVIYTGFRNIADWFAADYHEYVAEWGEEPPSQETMAHRVAALDVSTTGLISKLSRRIK